LITAFASASQFALHHPSRPWCERVSSEVIGRRDGGLVRRRPCHRHLPPPRCSAPTTQCFIQESERWPPARSDRRGCCWCCRRSTRACERLLSTARSSTMKKYDLSPHMLLHQPTHAKPTTRRGSSMSLSRSGVELGLGVAARTRPTESSTATGKSGHLLDQGKVLPPVHALLHLRRQLAQLDLAVGGVVVQPGIEIA
jgi:hypothetical protein